MTSPGARMSSNPIGHPGPPNAYRPPGMSPSMNQPRMYMPNPSGVSSINDFIV
jgi:hypothetical protein